ncbi:MAG: SusD/RagB family nutrient-binding outer membrane lipoprotein, partial [Sphingobacterium sp.]
VVLDGAFEDRLQFEYKDQPDVYKKVQVWCDSALYFLSQESFADNTALLAKYDYLYNGNMERWRKFIYGIKALNYARYINKPDFVTNYADSVMKYTSLSFASENDNAAVKFTGTNTDNSNVYGSDQALLNSTYYNRAGVPILRYLTGGVRGEYQDESKSSSDPRLSRMLKFQSATDSTYTGALPDGRAQSNAPVPTVGNFYMFKNTADFPIMTYGQMQFIRAEVALKKGDRTAAYEAYLNGIRGHMNFVNKYTAIKDENQSTTYNPVAITEEEITTYMDSTEVAQSAEELTLADIMGQKYIALWGWGGYDIWSDLRKYRYDPVVFRQFQPLSGVQLVHNDYTYRVRPRYNSE